MAACRIVEALGAFESMSSPSSSDQLRSVVAGVADPLYDRRLGELRLIKNVSLDGNRAAVAIELPSPGYPKQDELRSAIENAVRTALPDVSEIATTFTSVVRGKNAGGRVGLNIKNIISVGSGKGGVGKSTVAACLTYGLKHYGAQVGLLDADVYGPSIPHMLGVSGPPGVIERKTPDGQVVQRMVPQERDGIQLMSMGFLVKEEQAVIWRGPMLHKALQQFLQQTEWDDLDYLVIDLPPGTGDVSLTLSQLLGLVGSGRRLHAAKGRAARRGQSDRHVPSAQHPNSGRRREHGGRHLRSWRSESDGRTTQRAFPWRDPDRSDGSREGRRRPHR